MNLLISLDLTYNPCKIFKFYPLLTLFKANCRIFLIFTYNQGKSFLILPIAWGEGGHVYLVHVPNFWGVAGSEDFECATLPSTPLDFQSKIKNFCQPTAPKNQIEGNCHPPAQKWAKSKLRCFNKL